MSEVKSILISEETHEYMKTFSKKSGTKMKFIAEEAIKEYIEKWSVHNGKRSVENNL